MKAPHSVRIEDKHTGEFIAYLSHKNRTEWCWKKAMKHGLEYLRKNLDHKVRIEPA